MPRALVVSYFFPPIGGGGVYRPLGWARYLPEFGWDVTFLCAGPGGWFVEDESLLSRIPPGTEILRVDAPTAVALWRRYLVGPGERRARGPVHRDARDERLKSLARFFLLPDSYRAWAGPALRTGRARLAKGDIDVVLSTSPPETCHLVGESLAHGSGKRLPWIADFRDPWVALHYRKPPTSLHAALHHRMERRVFEKADRILCASRTHEGAVRIALGKAAGDRVVFLPNGAEPEPDLPGTAAPSTNGGGGRAGSPVRIVYTGRAIEVPALAEFLDATSRRLRDSPGLRGKFVLKLVGPYAQGYAERIRNLHLDDVVELTGPVSYAEARQAQREADVLLLVRNEGRGYTSMVPGKLYEYLDARRPIVAMISDGEAAGLARSCGATIVRPDHGDAAVEAALAASRRERGAAHPDENAIGALLTRRSRRALAGELAEILDQLVPGAAAQRAAAEDLNQRERRTSV